MASFHDFETASIDGDPVRLADYAGRVCLVVNLASRCGLTPQYEGLQRLQERYADQGFTVLGFPCNQFGGQEPGSDAEICEFARSRYGAEFPLFSKIEVNGPGTSDVYAFLKSGHPDAEGNEDIAWNFTKFLVGKDGAVIERFGPATTPEEIEKTLSQHL